MRIKQDHKVPKFAMDLLNLYAKKLNDAYAAIDILNAQIKKCASGKCSHGMKKRKTKP